MSLAHDGRHDFDFEVGRWKAHVKTLVHRLSGSSDWAEFRGTVVTRTLPMLEGRNESEMQVDSPQVRQTHRTGGSAHVQPVDPSVGHLWGAHQDRVFDPPMNGQFRNGRGEFYSPDMWDGRAIFVRFIWKSVDANRTSLEQAYSNDGAASALVALKVKHARASRVAQSSSATGRSRPAD
jgi:hypothetical protein